MSAGRQSGSMKPQEGQQQQMQQSRTKINASSQLLTPEENDVVFKMLGRKCQTLNTAVVQIYKTEGSAHSHWKKKHTGVVCFVKDSAIRSYFLRAYCLIKNELIWEHELYDAMKIVKARPFLLTFEGHDGHVGLNFVSEEECDAFYRAVDQTLETRNRRKMEKRSRPKSQLAPNAPLPREPYAATTRSTNQSQSGMGGGVTSTDAGVQLRGHPKIGTVTLTQTQPSPPTSAAAAPQPSAKGLFGLSSSSAAGGRDKKRKVTKADISTPTNFVHISHVGWDADKGFDLTGNENDEVLTTFLAKAGVSETEMKDRDTRAFIYDFIQHNNVLGSVKSEKPKTAAPAPPPVPTRHQHPQNGNGAGQRIAPPPPPPPARQPPPPVPTTQPGAGGMVRAPPPPQRPPPMSSVPPPPQQTTFGSAPAAAPPPPPPPAPAAAPAPPPPPPPPPPMQMAMDVPTITTTDAPRPTGGGSRAPPQPSDGVPDVRNALMDSIRKGTTLKKVDPAALSTGSSGGDQRNDLLSEIRTGIELRPAQNRELGAPVNRSSDDGGGGTDALADALRRALQERKTVIQSSDEESGGSSANDDEWDD